MSAYLEYVYHDPAETYSHKYLRAYIEAACQHAHSNIQVVDLGCGNGSLLASLKRPGWRACGVDLSSSGIAHGRLTYPSIEFHLSGFDDSLIQTLGPSQFDLVISTEVIEHLYAPRELCQAAFQLLRPGGRLVLSTPYHGYLKNCLLAISGKLDAHFTALWDCGHIKFWSYRTLRKLLSETGFVQFKFAGAGRVPWLWKSMVIVAEKPGISSIKGTHRTGHDAIPVTP